MSGLKRFHRGRGRRYWFCGAVLVSVALFGVVFVASSGAALSDSPFEGADGNMIVDAAGHTDWASLSAPQLRTLVDVPSGTSDNSFTQGTHEDDPDVTIATGSVPPNKNDLTRAYAATDQISNETFLYLAWERQPNPNGSANIDFELDQNASAGDFTQPGSLTINRTEGDVLITYDFGGSGTPDLGLLRWLTPGNGHSDNDCEASGATIPCWGNRIDLNPNSNPPAEAAVNSDTIDEVFAGGQLDAGSFGEAKIDLTSIAGLFTQDTCTNFGTMFVKSRSSGSSIDAELKDFIAPVPVHVSNCASPDIATETSVSSMTVGSTQTVGDTATLTNGDNPTGNVDFQLYSDSNCQNPVDGVSGSAPIDNGAATFVGTNFTPDHAGTYYWGVTYAGDNHNNPVSACGGDNEEIVVNPASPSVSTQQDPASGAIGDTYNDTATLSGGSNYDGSGSITFTLYDAADCEGNVLDTETVSNIDANGDYPTPTGFQIQNAGTYYWVASFSSDSNNNSFTSGCNDEPVDVAPNSPSIATLLSQSSVSVGTAVHDSATLSGETSDAGGTVTYSVYNDSGCSTKVADGGTVAVTDGAVPNSSGVTLNTAGTYYWQARYSGDPNNAPALSTCTDEKLVVSPLIDLAVTKAGSPASQTLGDGNITWTMVVTNNGPSTATGVTIADPMPAGNTFVSATTTQGSCTGGAILNCSLGTVAAGATVTITLVTTPSAAGTVTNTVTVVGNEQETNTANNTATASVQVNVFNPPPPVFCVAVSKVTPNQLFVGRKTKLTIHVTQHGQVVKGVHVQIKGPKFSMRTGASNSKGVITQTVKMKKAGIMVFSPIASKRCNTKRVGITGVFTPPVTG